jgi:tRNA pseudouridine55 synthase
MHGWLVIDKPRGPGSTDIVTSVKRGLRDGGYPRIKVGHGGTLDPLASGVLPIALGEATKLAGRMLDGDKAYEFTIRFGSRTTTLDEEGPVEATSDVRPDAHAIAQVLPRFTGDIVQVPPAYSALRIDGARAYDLARAGEEVSLPERAVTVYGIEMVGTLVDNMPRQEVTLAAHVSKGTYIRSLARDIAHALGTVGHVTHLRRTKAGAFGLAHAISLDKMREAAKARSLEDYLLPLRAGLDDIPALPLTPDQAGALRRGRVLDGIVADDGPAFALLGLTPVALVEVQDHSVRVVRGFNL